MDNTKTDKEKLVSMNKLMSAAAVAMLIGTAAVAQQSAIPNAQTLNAIPQNSTTVTNYYKQNVYDAANNKLGQVSDVLIDRSGKVTAIIIGVGGVLGAGEKDIALPFEAVRLTQDNNSWKVVTNATVDSLKNAPGFKYDRTAATWMPDTQPRSQ